MRAVEESHGVFKLPGAVGVPCLTLDEMVEALCRCAVALAYRADEQQRKLNGSFQAGAGGQGSLQGSQQAGAGGGGGGALLVEMGAHLPADTAR